MNQNYICATSVANSIIKRFHKDNLFITPDKLYSILYLVYEEFLYQTETKLFSEEFMIYEDKVIIPSVYFKFDCYKKQYIQSYAGDAKNNLYFSNGDMFNTCLETVYNQYKLCTDDELVAITLNNNIAVERCNEKKMDRLNDHDIMDNIIKRKEEHLVKVKIYNNSNAKG